jgi:hypothetical protein
MKKLFLIFVFVFIGQIAMGQTVVPKLSDIKKPKNGKLYYQDSDASLYIFSQKNFEKVFSKKTNEPDPEPEPEPEDDGEKNVGQWSVVPSSVLIIKTINGVKWLLQTDAARSYYVIRGKNFSTAPGVSMNEAIGEVANEVTGLDGLLPAESGSLPKKWQSPWWQKEGYTQNGNGEFVKKGNDEPVLKKKPLLVHVWGNGGQGFESEQGTQRSERWMLSQAQFRNQLPFYGYDHLPKPVIVDDWADNKIVGKKTVNVTVDYLMDEAAMAATVNYVKRAKLDGFNFLWYADDAILREWRRAFVALPDKKGLKMCYNLGSFGSGSEQYGQNNEYTRSINTIVSHLKADFYLKVDNKPVLSFMISDADMSDAAALSNHRRDIDRINKAYGGKIYWILNSDFYEKGDWYKQNGFDAITGYYLYGNYKNNDFSEVIEISKNYNTSHTAAGRVVAPIITCGLDMRARAWYYTGGDAGNNYYSRNSTLAGLPALIKNTVEFMNSTESVKVGFVNHADEHTEQGLGFLPTKNSKNEIDDSVVKIFESVL